ncbi:MAG: glycosyltransferase family protein [Pseudomonadota bacterium]
MKRSIAYFITAHGYGHAVRSSYLINQLGRENQITIISGIPKQFFDEEITVPFTYIQAEFDTGCVQFDTFSIDIESTQQNYLEQAFKNDRTLADWVNKLRDLDCDCIVSDVVPFAGVIANELNIPSISVSNFWWSDIYSAFPKSPDQEALLNRVNCEMNCFTHHVVLNPPMRKWESTPNVLTDVNLIRIARDRSNELREKLGIEQTQHLALLYTGNYGMNSVKWEKLSQFDNWRFIGLHPIPGKPSNFTLINKDQFTMQEFTASVDLVISKLGYGTVTESLASGTPLLYTPREGFAESPVLEKFLLPYGHCHCIEETEFNELKWESALDSLVSEGRRSFRLFNDTERVAKWILSR